MSAAAQVREAAPPRVPVARAPAIALLGTGTVGRAFVARHVRLREALGLPPLAWIANSREGGACTGDPRAVLARVAASQACAGGAPWAADAFVRGDIVVDASDSVQVAMRHAHWLRRGVHVVTANKQGAGGPLARARAIAQARHEGRAQYGDAATVGAGLPLLHAIRALVRGGGRIRAVEGVLSGSLAWLFGAYDGMRPFSGFVREARAAGYTEPDPRIDLSGEDVRRKLLILARAAGLPLEAGQVQVESLVPQALADAPLADVDAGLPALDAPLRERFGAARRDGAQLRFVGGFEVAADGHITARVGLRALPEAHPLCGGHGTDNRVAIRSCRYDAQPLVVQGPGAGADVTAAALLDDIVAICAARASAA